MSWADTVLTTNQSLESIEAEINKLKYRIGSDNISNSGDVAEATLPATDYALIEPYCWLNANGEERQVLTKAGSNVVTLNRSVDWSTGYEYAYGQWENKIAAAKKQIGNKLETFLIQTGFRGLADPLLDIISNPERLELASDYLTLALCYLDVTVEYDDIYKGKHETYMRLLTQSLTTLSKL